MKVLLINYMETTAPGGINKVVCEIAKNMAKNGHEIMVLQPNPLNLKGMEIYEGFKIIRINSRFGNYLQDLSPEMYFYLKNNIKKLKPDIIHIHGYHTLFSVSVMRFLSMNGYKGPIIFSPHLDIYKSSFAGKYLWNIYDFFGKGIFKKSSYIISVSDFEANRIFKDYKIAENKISVISHGVNKIDFNHKKIKNGKLNLIYSGYLVERKGVNHILESLDYLVNKKGMKNVALTIIGSGPDKDRLIKLSKSLKIDEYIEWKSFLTNEEYMNSIKESDFFMLLSNSEAYGITVAESLAIGTPCIVTNVAGLGDFKTEKGCFHVNYPPDPKKVGDLIIELYNKDIEVGPFSEKIRTWDKVTNDYERIYTKILKGEA